MSGVLIRLAAPEEFEAIGELREAAYSRDYEISDNYRATLRDVSAGGAEQEVWVGLDRHTGELLGTGPEMTGAHQLYYALGFTRLTERETRTVEGHTRPLLAFGNDVGNGTGLRSPR